MRIRIAFINKDGVEPCDLCPALDGGYDAGSVSDIDTNAAGERLTSARAAVESAETDGARSQAIRNVAIAEAMIAAAS